MSAIPGQYPALPVELGIVLLAAWLWAAWAFGL